MNKNQVVIGVDVGTGSARAGVFNLAGEMLSTARRDITLYQPQPHYAEQSSEEIWTAICDSVKQALAESGAAPESVAGIGFDATCSLVVVGHQHQPLPVNADGDARRDIIVWMDHRATEQTRRINKMGHPVLRYVGDKISPEMETPKLLWLKENLPETFNAAWQFFDLADWLTWRASGDLVRSVCTVTCKWTWLAHEKRWDDSYFESIGLEEFPREQYARIGQNMQPPGTACGQGVTAQAASQLGLLPGTPVAVGMIDAHAGGIGSVGVVEGALKNMAYVFGTSSCTMTTTEEPVFIPGVWGPYYSAMVPGMWLSEGGQSAAGAAIDRLLSLHPAASDAKAEAKRFGKPLPVYLADLLLEQVEDISQTVMLARGIHVVPEFLGNRAPFADPDARAIIAGLDMDSSFQNLLQFYVAGVCGIGYGLRQILEVQDKAGAPVDNIVISGGAGQHPLIRQLLADACWKPILSTRAAEPVLLGSAILGAVAGGVFATLPEGMAALSSVDLRYLPDAKVYEQHEKRYRSFTVLQQTAKTLEG